MQYGPNDAGANDGRSWICVRAYPDGDAAGALLPTRENGGVAEGARYWDLLANAGDDAVAGEGIDWRGPWVANADPPYEDQDAVSHGGRSYIAHGDPDASTPPPGSTWQLMADRGQAAAFFASAVVEVPVRAVGTAISEAASFDPDPATATLTLHAGGRTTDVEISGDIAVDENGNVTVTPTLSGAAASQFEIVT